MDGVPPAKFVVRREDKLIRHALRLAATAFNVCVEKRSKKLLAVADLQTINHIISF